VKFFLKSQFHFFDCTISQDIIPEFFRFLEKQRQDEVRRAKERLDAVKQKEVNVDQNLSEHEQMLQV
jgi:hypothetical protein